MNTKHTLTAFSNRLASLSAESLARQSDWRHVAQRELGNSAPYVIAVTIVSPLAAQVSTNMVNGKLADAGVPANGQARVKSLLDEDSERVWRDQLRYLSLLLKESGADRLGAILYSIDEQLFCEVGPAGSSLVLSIDEEGSILTFQDPEQGGGIYRCVTWNSLPSSDQFNDELRLYRLAHSAVKGASYLLHGVLKWRRLEVHSPATNLSDVDLEMVPALRISSTMTKGFAFS